jgi:hypothetical protein
MAEVSELGQAGYNAQPVFYTDDKMAWEQRLALAYDEASNHVRAALPPGTTIDLAKYELAADLAGSQIKSNAGIWTPAFETESDVPEQAGVRLTPAEAREYYLGHYAKASANLGAFISGSARQQVVKGALSQAEFNRACDMRLRELSDLIYMGRTGSLQAALDPEGWQRTHGASSDRIILSKGGITTPSYAVGLGELGTVTIVAIVIVLALVGAGIAVAVMYSAENMKLRRVALEICQDAVRSGNPDAKAICGSMEGLARDLSDPAKASFVNNLIPPELQTKLLTLGAIGLGTAIAIQYLPRIIDSIEKSKDVHAAAKLRRLRQMETLA